MSDVLLEVADLHVRFPGEGVHAVRGVSFRLERGEVLAVVGESGSGKSVTARSLLGLAGEGADVTAETMQVVGEDVQGFSKHQWKVLRGRSVGLVSQDALVSLDPLRRIGKEVSDAPVLHKLISDREREEFAARTLSDVHVPEPEERIRQYPHELSGGLRQRSLIASGISADPDVIILDEPTTALDVTTQARILDLLRQLRDDGDVGMLFISHDLAVVSAIADRIIVMRDGVVVEEGVPHEVLTHPRHPYTQKLLSAVPAGKPKGTRLSAVERPARPRPLAARESSEAEIVLEGVGLTKVYARRRGGDRFATRDVDFALSRGKTLGIVGESGSGKTTVARMALALITPTAGEARLFGEAWSALPLRHRQSKRRRIQMIAQDPLSSFDPRYTVERLLMEPLRLYVGGDGKTRRSTAERLLDEVGLSPSILPRRPLQLSGGQRQRLAIARALAPMPDILVCDEPVSALDVSVQAQVLDLLADLQAERGLSMLFVSHDLGVIQHVSDEVLVMKDGEVVESGDARAVISAPEHPYTQTLLTALPQIDVVGR